MKPEAILFLIVGTLLLTAIWFMLINALSVPEKLTRKQAAALEDAVFFMSMFSALWLASVIYHITKFFTL